jgi:hypothetical protein
MRVDVVHCIVRHCEMRDAASAALFLLTVWVVSAGMGCICLAWEAAAAAVGSSVAETRAELPHAA